MRELIFEPIWARLVYSCAGRLKLLHTGTDGYAEHNNAAELLAPKICAGFTAATSVTEAYRVSKVDLVQFFTLPGENGEPVEAVLGVNEPGGHMFTGSRKHPLNHPTVLKELCSYRDDVAVAVAWGNFAIRVRGAEAVAALAHFHKELLAGHVVLVHGARVQREGITLVNLMELSQAERDQLDADIDAYLKASLKRNQKPS